MGNQVSVDMGATSTSNFTNLYDGIFDNAYYSNPASGYMYFCGNLTTGASPTLKRVTFNSTGAMTGLDSTFTQIQLSTASGTASNCSPLTEVYNATLGHDFLFVGVKSGADITGCSFTTCIISWDLGAEFALAATTAPSFAGSDGISGIIIDNVETTNGGSQIYFGAPNSGNAVQLSQSNLN